jgi:hypothetical protein
MGRQLYSRPMRFKTSLLFTGFALASIAANAQTFNLRTVLRPGTTIGGHAFADDTTIDTTALNDRGDVAFVASWFEGNQKRTAVFTSSRIVAREGDVIDGKILERIIGTTLAINNRGQVAFEAFYADNPTPQAQKGMGAFIDGHFAMPLAFAGPSIDPDFILTEDGKILPRIGYIPPAPPKKKDNALAHIRITNLPNPVKVAMSKIPVAVDPGIITPKAEAPAAQFATYQPVHPVCAAPIGIAPLELAIGAPVASRLMEPPIAGRVYDSPTAGHFSAPFRIVHFGADCRLLLVSIGDAAVGGVFEVWARNGLLTRLKLDRTFDFGDLPEKVRSDSFLRSETLRINGRNEVLLQVSLWPRGTALLLATPIQ